MFTRWGDLDLHGAGKNAPVCGGKLANKTNKTRIDPNHGFGTSGTRSRHVSPSNLLKSCVIRNVCLGPATVWNVRESHVTPEVPESCPANSGGIKRSLLWINGFWQARPHAAGSSASLSQPIRAGTTAQWETGAPSLPR